MIKKIWDLGIVAKLKNITLLLVIMIELLQAVMTVWNILRDVPNYVDESFKGLDELFQIYFPLIFMIGVLSFVVILFKITGLARWDAKTGWYHLVSLLTIILSRIISVFHIEKTAPSSLFQLSFTAVLYASIVFILLASEWQINHILNGKKSSLLVKNGMITSVIVGVLSVGMIGYKIIENNGYWTKAISAIYPEHYTTEIDQVWRETIFSYHVSDGIYTIPAGAVFTDNGELRETSFRSPAETPWAVLPIATTSPAGQELVAQLDAAVAEAYQKVVNEQITPNMRYDFDSGYLIERTETINPALIELMQSNREKGEMEFDGLATVSITDLVEQEILIPSTDVTHSRDYEPADIVAAIDASKLLNGKYKIDFLSKQASLLLRVRDGKIAEIITQRHEQGYRIIHTLDYIHSSTNY